MSKKLKISLCLLLAICMGALISGCNKPPAPPKNCEAVVEATLYSGTEGCKDFVAICRSLDELEEECLRNGYDFFNESNSQNNCYDSEAGKKIREYNDEYFQSKVFAVCAFFSNGRLGQYRIEEAEVAANKLTLYIRRPKKNDAADVINNVFLIAGVDKSLVSQVTSIEYVLR